MCTLHLFPGTSPVCRLLSAQPLSGLEHKASTERMRFVFEDACGMCQVLAMGFFLRHGWNKHLCTNPEGCYFVCICL